MTPEQLKSRLESNGLNDAEIQEIMATDGEYLAEMAGNLEKIDASVEEKIRGSALAQPLMLGAQFLLDDLLRHQGAAASADSKAKSLCIAFYISLSTLERARKGEQGK